MKCCILHESSDRLRVHMAQPTMSLRQADVLEYYLTKIDGVKDVTVNDRTQNVIIYYDTNRSTILSALATFHYEEQEDLVPNESGRALSREFEDKIIHHTLRRVISKCFLPLPIRASSPSVSLY